MKDLPFESAFAILESFAGKGSCRHVEKRKPKIILKEKKNKTNFLIQSKHEKIT